MKRRSFLENISAGLVGVLIMPSSISLPTETATMIPSFIEIHMSCQFLGVSIYDLMTRLENSVLEQTLELIRAQHVNNRGI